MSFSLHQIAYIHADNETLFRNISFTVNKGEKVALVGPNGSGKSTLLHIIEGSIPPTEGEVIHPSPPYYVPQHFGQYDTLTVAEALRVERKLNAFRAIIAGDASAENFALLNDDWEIEERCMAAFSYWDIDYLQLNQTMNTLSGGEKTKVFLCGLQIHSPEVILLDEPTNHLDRESRSKVYSFIETCRASVLVVSHDITLLNLLPSTLELGANGVTLYGGNYSFYKEQKTLQAEALQSTLDAKEKELRMARKIARETAERKQKHEVRGKKQNQKSGLGKMAMNTFKDKAEKSASKLKDIHEEKSGQIQEQIKQLRNTLTDENRMKVNFNSSDLHIGKILIKGENLNHSYNSAPLWRESLNLIIRSGDRIVINGNNGSGKTTLLKIINGLLVPTEGKLEKADFSYVYIDQEYSIIQNRLTVYEQAEHFNTRHFPEHEIKTFLNRYLFPHDTWDKPCDKLSGGEKMRLMFCCLMIGNQKPDLFILDEPTNNLDIDSIEIITRVIKEYKGTVLVVSHDQYFINEIGIDKEISL